MWSFLKRSRDPKFPSKLTLAHRRMMLADLQKLTYRADNALIASLFGDGPLHDWKWKQDGDRLSRKVAVLEKGGRRRFAIRWLDDLSYDLDRLLARKGVFNVLFQTGTTEKLDVWLEIDGKRNGQPHVWKE